MLSYEAINDIERTLGPQAGPVVSALQALDRRIEEQKLEVKKDLLIELATKADIEKMQGSINTLAQATKADIEAMKGAINTLTQATKVDIERLQGSINTLAQATRADIQELRGEIKRLEVFMKVLIGLSILAMAFFSPNAAELLRLLK